ncbi:MAG: hypothetical protein M1834_008583 [Cirrosporium novae-zelandiae]|nr:MAG: hypothetical protein M1834_008583 [Cirrosporium novae-zelandiae]
MSLSSTVIKEGRATDLAKEAIDLFNSGKIENSQRKLREAISISPHLPQVKAAFEQIKHDDDLHPLLRLCQKLLVEKDEEAGKEALRHLSSSNQAVSKDVGEQCLKLFLGEADLKSESLQKLRDSIIARLLSRSAGARAFLASELQRSTTEVFEKVFGLGDEAANVISSDILDAPSWPSEDIRCKVERDIFTLFLAKHMESGQDFDGRAIKAIARIMAADAEKIIDLIDTQSFEMILGDLDNRAPDEVRSQATLATTKYLELMGKTGETTLTEFVVAKVQTQKTQDLILAFSAAASVFPIVPTTASNLLLTEGFLTSLVITIERKHKSAKLEQAALEMLSAACIDRSCREAIKKSCTHWLNIVMNSGNEQRAGIAAVILAKTKGSPVPSKSGDNGANSTSTKIETLVEKFKSMALKKDDIAVHNSIEGLAYTSMQPKVKEGLAKDPIFLKNLINVLDHVIDQPSVLFGGLTILNNLTQYPPDLTEEQKRMSQLKSYAAAAKPAEPSPLEDDEHIAARCKAILAAGVMPLVVKASKRATPTSLTLILYILLSLSKTTSTRGPIAQQGGIKVLLSAYEKLSHNSSAPPSSVPTAAHALARVLISVDPALVFPLSSTPHPTSAARPLISLLPSDSESSGFSSSDSQPRSLLPAFEALLALTNLASLQNAPTVATLIAKLVSPLVTDLLLHQNSFICRATTQLLCNLCICDEGLSLLIPKDPNPGLPIRETAPAHHNQILTIILALTDSEDEQTRIAAGGTVAFLVETSQGCHAILARPNDNGIKKILRMCDSKEPEPIVHRGMAAMCSLCSDEKEGEKAREKFKSLNALDTLRQVGTRGLSRPVMEVVVEAARILLNA